MKNMKKMELNSDDQFSTTKYIIKLQYVIKGIVSVMDIIGALFGQTEGLLNDLELRELQKSGRIGRIQVENSSEKGSSNGIISIPSSLDRVETAILAATIESVDRVGPCSAQMSLIEILDIREDKRKKIMDRAQQLLQKWEQDTPESAEIGETILEKIRTGELIEYGPEKLAAGEDIGESQQIVIVEGIADVKTMMRAGFRNAIGTNGTNIPKSIISLSKKKSCIAFVDGDRGGEMILDELIQVAEIDFIAVAPKGLMVEELTRKQIIKHLQNKKSVKEYLSEKEQRERSQKARSSKDYNKRKNGRRSDYNRQDKRNSGKQRRFKPSSSRFRESVPREKIEPIDPVIKEHMKIITASNEALGLNEKNEQVFKVGNTQVFTTLDTESAKKLIIDGVVTQRLLDKAAEKSVEEIYAINRANNLNTKNIKIRLFHNYIKD
ncbi:MAG: DNA primase [archaeon]|nr:DNA primase [archaeon]